MPFQIGDNVLVRNIQNTSDRIQISSSQSKMIACRGIITGDLENGFFNIKHRQGYFVWHESSLGKNQIVP